MAIPGVELETIPRPAGALAPANDVVYGLDRNRTGIQPSANGFTGSAISPRTIAAPGSTQLFMAAAVYILVAQFPAPTGICTGALACQAHVICRAPTPAGALAGTRRLI